MLHGLLQHHYVHTCRSSWLTLLVADTGAYCAFVRKGLTALQWSPVLALLRFPPAAGLLEAWEVAAPGRNA